MSIPEEPQAEVRHNLELPDDVEVGVFADFANIWHTPATFVLDFLSVRMPATRGSEDGTDFVTLSSKVAARVRIPPEQIFPLMEALQSQSQQWLHETGRSEPPETWLTRTQPEASEPAVELPTDEEES